MSGDRPIPVPIPSALSSAPGTRTYRKLFKLASGGMGTVYVGLLESALGFRQVVALKEAHPHLFEDPEVRRTLAEEALLAARLHHANVVEVRDVEVTDQGITLVMPYIEGASLSELQSACVQPDSRGVAPAREQEHETIEIPPGVALRIVLDACAGLGAAHELTNEEGVPLSLVHRDVSPQNLLIGTDGVTRVTDFGVAKHRRADGHSTTQGTFKGKLAYSSPEYLRGQAIDARLDVFSLGVVLWELLAMERLFLADGELETLERVQRHRPRKISVTKPELAPLDPVLEKALQKSKSVRTPSMATFSSEIEEAARGKIGTHRDVAAFLVHVLGPQLEARRATVRDRLRSEGAPLVPTPAPSAVAALGPTGATLPAVSTDRFGVPTKPWRRGVIAVAAGVLVALGVGGGMLLSRMRSEPRTRASADERSSAPVASATTKTIDAPGPSTPSSPSIAAAKATDNTAVASSATPRPPAPSVKPVDPRRIQKRPAANPPVGAPPPNPYPSQ